MFWCLLSYESMTLEDVEMYQYYDFVCDGDSHQLIVNYKG